MTRTTATRVTQADFAAALLDPGRGAPAGLTTWNGSDPTRRFDVYRNNVVVSLVDALAEALPVVRQLVGDAFFRAMAAAFARAHPPRSPVLAEYGDAFADWVGGFVPAAALPYLADLARLERARTWAAHAADARPLPRDALERALADPARLASRALALHPSLTVVRSRYAVVSLWRAHQTDDARALGLVDWMQAEAALVLRCDDDVLVLALPIAAAAFVAALADGATLGAAAASAAAADVTLALALLIGHGALVEPLAGAQP